MYTALLLLGYYGLFRIGELTTGDHPMKYGDVMLGINKRKIQIILRLSKTHTKSDHPQIVKNVGQHKISGVDRVCKYCPTVI